MKLKPTALRLLAPYEGKAFSFEDLPPEVQAKVLKALGHHETAHMDVSRHLADAFYRRRP